MRDKSALKVNSSVEEAGEESAESSGDFGAVRRRRRGSPGADFSEGSLKGGELVAGHGVGSGEGSPDIIEVGGEAVGPAIRDVSNPAGFELSLREVSREARVILSNTLVDIAT